MKRFTSSNHEAATLLQGLALTLLVLFSQPGSVVASSGWFEVSTTGQQSPEEHGWQEVGSMPARNAASARNEFLATTSASRGNYRQIHTAAPRSPSAVEPRFGEPDRLVKDSGDAQSRVGNYSTKFNQSATVNVDMFVGEVKVMGRVDVSRVANGNGSILRAEVLDTGELMIIAKAEGSSSVRLWHKDGYQTDYNIRVSSTDPETRVRRETMIRMRVRMIEFRKSALGKLGIDWSDSTTGPGFAIAGDAVGNTLFRPESDSLFSNLQNTVKPFTGYFGIASNISSRINMLASTGDATTLAEPVLSAMNGGTASFLAGGEVPYPTIGSNGQTMVQFKEYGIKLLVSPSIDASGVVRTVIDTEISQLDPAVSVQGAPGLLSRKAQTEVNVHSGETIVISGLLSSDSSKDIDKVPGISRLPVIGQFFRTKNARKTVNELVIFVTPEVIQHTQSGGSQRNERLLSAAVSRAANARSQLPVGE